MEVMSVIEASRGQQRRRETTMKTPMSLNINNNNGNYYKNYSYYGNDNDYTQQGLPSPNIPLSNRNNNNNNNNNNKNNNNVIDYASSLYSKNGSAFNSNFINNNNSAESRSVTSANGDQTAVQGNWCNFLIKDKEPPKVRFLSTNLSKVIVDVDRCNLSCQK